MKTTNKITLTVALLALAIGAAAASATYNSYSEALDAARVSYSAKKYAQARTDLEQALSLAQIPAEKSATLVRIGQTYSDQKQEAKARAIWSKVLQMSDAPTGDRFLARFGIAGSYINEKKFAQGRKELDALIADSNTDAPTKISVQSARAASYLAEQNPGKAREGFAVVWQNENADPNLRANAQIQIGQTWFNVEDYAKARDAWTQVLSLKGVAPSIALTVRLALADTYVQEKNPAAAEGQFAWARAITLQMAQQAIGRKNFSQARVSLQQAVLLGKPDAFLTAALKQKIGETYLAQRDFEAARREFASVLAMPRVNLSGAQQNKLQTVKDATQISVAQSYRMEGNNAQARTEFLKVTERSGVDPNVKAEAERQLALLPK